MSRRTLIWTTVLLAACLPALAAPAEDEIRATEKEWSAAVVAQDFAKLDRFLNANLIYAHSTGAVESKEAYLKRLHSGAQKYDAIEYEKTVVHVYGDTAVAHSHLTMRGMSNGAPFNDRLMMMHVWVKTDGHWQLAAHQTTKLP
jgi:ketosteroid isomerase-like protein